MQGWRGGRGGMQSTQWEINKLSVWNSGISGSLIRGVPSLEHCINAKGMKPELPYRTGIMIMIKTMVVIGLKLCHKFPFTFRHVK
jgi:hypothetical protein